MNRASKVKVDCKMNLDCDILDLATLPSEIRPMLWVLKLLIFTTRGIFQSTDFQGYI